MHALARTRSLNRLATARRINTAADDPAGLIASQSLDATLAALDAETRANERAVVEADTADGALGEISDMLAQAKGLVVANANDAGLSADEKAANQLQLDSILSTVDRVSSSTSFLGRKLLDGSGSVGASGATFAIAGTSSSRIGKTTDTGTTYSLADLKSGKALNVTSGNVNLAGDVIDQAISDVSTIRGGLGAFQTYTLQARLSGIATAREHLTRTVSMIRDTDYAAEVSNDIRTKLLTSATYSAQKQSNGRRPGLPPGSIFSIRA